MIKPKGFCCPVAYVLEETASPGGLSSQMHLTFLQPGILGSDLPPEISPKKSISTVVILKSKTKLVMRAESFREVIPGVPVDFPPSALAEAVETFPSSALSCECFHRERPTGEGRK